MKLSNSTWLVMAILSTVIMTGCATTPPARCTEDFTPINANATETVQP